MTTYKGSLPPPLDASVRWHVHQHAVERARSRYRLDLSACDLDEITRRIETDHPTTLVLERHHGESRSLVAIYWHDAGERPTWFTKPFSYRWMLVVYESRNKTIVTFLPRRDLEPYWLQLSRAKRKAKGSIRRSAGAVLTASEAWAEARP